MDTDQENTETAPQSIPMLAFAKDFKERAISFDREVQGYINMVAETIREMTNGSPIFSTRSARLNFSDDNPKVREANRDVLIDILKAPRNGDRAVIGQIYISAPPPKSGATHAKIELRYGTNMRKKATRHFPIENMALDADLNEATYDCLLKNIISIRNVQLDPIPADEMSGNEMADSFNRHTRIVQAAMDIFANNISQMAATMIGNANLIRVTKDLNDTGMSITVENTINDKRNSDEKTIRFHLAYPDNVNDYNIPITYTASGKQDFYLRVPASEVETDQGLKSTIYDQLRLIIKREDIATVTKIDAALTS